MNTKNVSFQRGFETVSKLRARAHRLRCSHFSATRATANNRRIDGCGMLRKPWKIFREANRSPESKYESILRPSRERGIARSRVTDKADDVAFLPRAERTINSDKFCTGRGIEFVVKFDMAKSRRKHVQHV